MPAKLSEDKKETLEYVMQIKKAGLLPTRYAKEIKERYPHLGIQSIHSVAAGKFHNPEIVDAIIELASENKEKQRIEKLKALLADD